jgi:hypothetical protein
MCCLYNQTVEFSRLRYGPEWPYILGPEWPYILGPVVDLSEMVATQDMTILTIM